VPLFDSYKNPRPREKFSNKGLLSHTYWDYMQDGGDSDVEEDLATLHRFDFYFEVRKTTFMTIKNFIFQNIRTRQGQAGWISDSSGDEDSDDSFFGGLLSATRNANGEYSTDDETESFLSEISDEDQQAESPTPYLAVSDEENNDEMDL
jgi:hypothetical protein